MTHIMTSVGKNTSQADIPLITQVVNAIPQQITSPSDLILQNPLRTVNQFKKQEMSAQETLIMLVLDYYHYTSRTTMTLFSSNFPILDPPNFHRPI